MVSDAVVKLCQAQVSVSAELAKDPARAPSDICRELYGPSTTAKKVEKGPAARQGVSPQELERARQCGEWGPTEPSDLFLRIYHDVLACIDEDPLGGMVSPSLLGSYGTVPLTIISPLVDIVRHKSNLIVRAQEEVILVSCSWSPSVAIRLVHDALVELSKRAGSRNSKINVKVMFDKAGPAHFVNARQHLKPDEYSSKSIGLPKPEQMPNIDIEVMSFHKPLLGTLHAKFMVVDRKIAVVESNNMEDNDNMEMMAQVEGPIVNSILDTALITWGDAPRLPLRSLDLPAAGDPASSAHVGNESVYTARGAAREQAEIAADGNKKSDLPEHNPGDPHYDDTTAEEITRMQSAYSSKPGESHLEAVNRGLNLAAHNEVKATSPEIPDGQEYTPYIPIDATKPSPIAMVSRPPYGPPDNSNTMVPQDEAWLSAIYHAKQTIFIQTPDLNAVQLYDALKSALARGVEITYYVCLGYNDPGELMPGQGGTNEMFASKFTSQLSSEERQRLRIGYYVGKDQDKPIHNSFKARSCHIKLLIADGHLGIQGSGNQDTQSWCHSQEINVMVDSEEVCRKWREGIDRNQNTARFGLAQQDGVWRDENGHEAEGSTGKPSAPVGWVKGAIGMIKKAQAQGHPKE